jgi:serine/threonine protein kinase
MQDAAESKELIATIVVSMDKALFLGFDLPNNSKCTKDNCPRWKLIATAVLSINESVLPVEGMTNSYSLMINMSYTNIAVTGAKIKCCPHVPGLQKGARGCTCRHTVKLDTSTSQAMDEYPIEIFESLLSLGSYNVSCSSPKRIGRRPFEALATLLISVVVVSLISIMALVCYKRRRRTKLTCRPIGTVQEVAYDQQEDDIYEDPDSLLMVTHGSQFSTYSIVPSWEERQRSLGSCPQTKESLSLSSDASKAWTKHLYEMEDNTAEQYWEPAEKVAMIFTQMNNALLLEIPSNLLQLTQIIGEGEFGEVWKATWKAPQGPIDVAIKVLKESHEMGEKESHQLNLLKEAAVMGQFKHQNVVRLHGMVTVTQSNMMVMEYLASGNMRDHLLRLKADTYSGNKQLMGQTLLTFSRQIACGMRYLSNKGYVHRDLAARNILLDNMYNCKISDFGMSRVINNSEVYYFTSGGNIPIKWTAPEAILERKYSTSSDVWSYGMVLYEIWSLGEKPFRNKQPIELISTFQARADYIHSPPTGCPRGIYKLMIMCWNFDHHGRPSFDAIYALLQGNDNDLVEVSQEEAAKTANPTSVKQLGGDPEVARDLYGDLQTYYSAVNIHSDPSTEEEEPVNTEHHDQPTLDVNSSMPQEEKRMEDYKEVEEVDNIHSDPSTEEEEPVNTEHHDQPTLDVNSSMPQEEKRMEDYKEVEEVDNIHSDPSTEEEEPVHKRKNY